MCCRTSLQPPVGRRQHGRHPVAARIECGAPGLGGDVLGVVLPEGGLHLVARAGAPPHRPGVAEEHHRAHDAVAQRMPVAVCVVGLRQCGCPRSLRAYVTNGMGAVSRPERRAGEREASCRPLERLAHRVAPAEGVTRRDAPRRGSRACAPRSVSSRCRLARTATCGVGDHDAVELARLPSVAVAEARDRAGCRPGVPRRPTGA